MLRQRETIEHAPDYRRALYEGLIELLRSKGPEVLAPVRDRVAARRAFDSVERMLRAMAAGVPQDQLVVSSGDESEVEEVDRQDVVELYALAENGLAHARQTLALLRARRDELLERAVDREAKRRMLNIIEADLVLSEESNLRELDRYRDLLDSPVTEVWHWVRDANQAG